LSNISPASLPPERSSLCIPLELFSSAGVIGGFHAFPLGERANSLKFTRESLP
jgi:hypothetical protein